MSLGMIVRTGRKRKSTPITGERLKTIQGIKCCWGLVRGRRIRRKWFQDRSHRKFSTMHSRATAADEARINVKRSKCSPVTRLRCLIAWSEAIKMIKKTPIKTGPSRREASDPIFEVDASFLAEQYQITHPDINNPTPRSSLFVFGRPAEPSRIKPSGRFPRQREFFGAMNRPGQ